MDNTDVGSLKGLLTARGHKPANYKIYQFVSKESQENQYQDQVREYNNVINPSVIMTVQAQFDQLIHGIVTMINDTLCPIGGNSS